MQDPRRRLSLLSLLALLPSQDASFAPRPAPSGDGSTPDPRALIALSRRAGERGVAAKREAEDWARAKGWPIRDRLASGQVIEIVAIECGRPVYLTTLNRFAADSIGVDELWPGGSAGLALRGANVLLGAWDGGLARESHRELIGRVFDLDTPAFLNDGDHATHVVGTMTATGIDPEAAGMAPEATVHGYDWLGDVAEMSAKAASATPCSASNHSYGALAGWHRDTPLAQHWTWLGDVSVSADEDPAFGKYGSKAWDVDELAFDAPAYLICVAAGNDRGEGPGAQPVAHYHPGDSAAVPPSRVDVHPNDGGASGYDTLPGGGGDLGVAKNVLTVGAVADLPGGWRAASDVQMVPFSSWGPTDDGRIKPDVCAVGWKVYSCRARTDDDYGEYTGTSFACPSVTGAMALLVELWRSLHGGAEPRSATLKALAIHAADDAGPPGPDYSFGYGVFDAREAAELIRLDASQPDTIIEGTLREGEAWRRRILADGSAPLKVTLVWTDPLPDHLTASTSLDAPDPMLRNDLDLRLGSPYGSSPHGTIHEPWVLDPAQPALAATTGDNDVDNVEQVLLASPGAGEYTIVIRHDGLLYDPRNPAQPEQDFSLVVSGATALARTQRVSVSSIGEESAYGADDATNPGTAISGDGRFVAFTDGSPNLVSGDTNGAPDVFVHDRRSATTVRVSVSSSEAEADDASRLGTSGSAMTPDGRFVAFESRATNLVPVDTNGMWDIFVRDRDFDRDGIFDEDVDVTVRVNVGPGGAQSGSLGRAAWRPSISADGRYVAFNSNASDLVPNDLAGDDVFVHDRDPDANGVFDQGNGTTILVTPAPFVLAASRNGSISADGRYVAFDSNWGWVGGSQFGTFVKDLATGEYTRVRSDDPNDVARSGLPRFAGSSRYFVYRKMLTITPPVRGLYVHDTATGGDSLTTSDLVVSSGSEDFSASDGFSSADLRFVTFTSGTQAPSFCLYDRQTGRTLGLAGAGSWPALSADGRWVAFQAADELLVPGPTLAASRCQTFVVDVLGAALDPPFVETRQGDAEDLQVAFRLDVGATSQWRRDGIDVAGATQPDTFSIVGAQPSDAGVYDVFVSDTSHPWAATSLPAIVRVKTPLGFWRQPLGGRYTAGSELELMAGVTGWPLEQCQWHKDGAPIPGANGAVLRFSALMPSDSGDYHVVVSNAGGSVASATARIRVIDFGLRPGGSRSAIPPQ